jgi:hypothetical protein
MAGRNPIQRDGRAAALRRRPVSHVVCVTAERVHQAKRLLGCQEKKDRACSPAYIL